MTSQRRANWEPDHGKRPPDGRCGAAQSDRSADSARGGQNASTECRGRGAVGSEPCQRSRPRAEDAAALTVRSSRPGFVVAEMAGSGLVAALRDVADLHARSGPRDALWIQLWTTITTRTAAAVVPCGSSRSVRVTSDEASAEVLAAWDWITRDEARARAMSAGELYRTLRGVATRSCSGSGRVAAATSVCGLTHVPADVWVSIGSDECLRWTSA
jgi:hypothetical protein